MTRKECIWQWWMDKMSPTCHQRSERSFFYHGWQFPVCARCTGLYVGYLIGFILLWSPLKIPFWLCIFFLMCMLIDWYLQYRQLFMSTNIRRLITGLCAGMAMIQLLESLLMQLGKMLG